MEQNGQNLRLTVGCFIVVLFASPIIALLAAPTGMSQWLTVAICFGVGSALIWLVAKRFRAA